VQDHVALMQQMATTNDLVAQLVAEQKETSPGAQGARGSADAGLRQPNTPPQHRPVGHRFRHEDEFQVHRTTLPKLLFPKFSGENPRIWVDKCCDYFRIFNIPECLWTTAVSLHMEDNAAKWL
jgi:hypothetical protein